MLQFSIALDLHMEYIILTLRCNDTMTSNPNDNNDNNNNANNNDNKWWQ